jgi:hypothetical protein
MNNTDIANQNIGTCSWTDATNPLQLHVVHAHKLAW